MVSFSMKSVVLTPMSWLAPDDAGRDAVAFRVLDKHDQNKEDDK